MHKPAAVQTVLSCLIFIPMIILGVTSPFQAVHPASEDLSVLDPPIKLIFIHHSSGENWLADENGGLGLALAQNNYFVSDTNYGWGPGSIGDRTDIPNWLEWFRGENTADIMQAVYTEGGQNSSYTRLEVDPGGENRIILFKSCFPNSNLEGSPDDPAAAGEGLTVANAKYVYNEILGYFQDHPDRLFIVVTAPPLLGVNTTSENAANARAFNNWLVKDWLSSNQYPYSNVAVFDFYNVLTGSNHHHRIQDGTIQHIYSEGKNFAAYPSASDDDHPSSKGNRKATEEFIPLLNYYVRRWLEDRLDSQPAATEAALLPTEAVQNYQEPSPQTGEQTNSPAARLPCLSTIILPLAVISLLGLGRRRS